MFRIICIGLLAGVMVMQVEASEGLMKSLNKAAQVTQSLTAPETPAATTAEGAVDLAGQAAESLGLVSMLSGQLGVTEAQASSGAGAIFSVAKQKMSAESFASLGSAVPNLDQLLAAAPAIAGNSGGNSSGLMGKAASMLGGSGASGGTMAMLGPVFESLGMNASMVGQFLPVVLQFVQTQGGDQLMGVLQQALL